MTAAGWDIRQSGPAGADRTVLLLPGALSTAMFYEDLMAEPALAGIRLVAATLPGQGGTPAPDDLSIGNYARLAAYLAGELGCHVVVGHSLGANVALEMAATGRFTGPLVLLAPSLSRTDESMFPRVLDRLGRILGDLPFAAAIRMIGPAMRSSLPPARRDAMVAVLRRNEPRVMRRHLRAYLGYLDHHGSVAGRLCGAGVPTWLVYGDRDDVGLTADERATLESCPHTTVVTIPGAGHFTANQEPARVAEVVVTALDQVR
jgi:pimeloyl-ACP methyl ester carboxylesterase